MCLQLDLFRRDDFEILEDQVCGLEKSQSKLRKAIFAKHGELNKRQVELEARIEIIEKHLCKGGEYYVW